MRFVLFLLTATLSIAADFTTYLATPIPYTISAITTDSTILYSTHFGGTLGSTSITALATDYKILYSGRTRRWPDSGRGLDPT